MLHLQATPMQMQMQMVVLVRQVTKEGEGGVGLCDGMNYTFPDLPCQRLRVPVPEP